VRPARGPPVAAKGVRDRVAHTPSNLGGGSRALCRGQATVCGLVQTTCMCGWGRNLLLRPYRRTDHMAAACVGPQYARTSGSGAVAVETRDDGSDILVQLCQEMVRKLSTWLLVALAGGALIAGCGSSTNTPSRTRTTPAAGATLPTATTTKPTAANTTSTGATTSGGPSTSKSTSSSQTTPTAATTTSTGTATGAGTTGAGPSHRPRFDQQLAKDCAQTLATRSLSAGQRTALEELCKNVR
jgi:hypothetical protein